MPESSCSKCASSVIMNTFSQQGSKKIMFFVFQIQMGVSFFIMSFYFEIVHGLVNEGEFCFVLPD